MNITIDKAVLELALEALNHGITEMNHRGCAIECMSLHHATKAIREELAQPKQEPVAKVQVKMTGGNAGIATMIYEIYDPRREPLKPGDMLYASPQAQAAQPLTVAGGAVFQDAEGKRPVTAIGQPVGRWKPTPLFPPGGAGVFLEKPHHAQPQPVQQDRAAELEAANAELLEALRQLLHEDSEQYAWEVLEKHGGAA